MHPPFFVVDHKIAADIHPHASKPVKRRAAPDRLVLTPATSGWPPVPLIADLPQNDVLGLRPDGICALQRPQLQVVPPPQPTLRHIVGRLLIRAGQRMILENRA